MRLEDLTMSCESWDSNSMFDVVPFPTQDNHMNPIALYLGEHVEQYLTHPYVSPLFGNFLGLPPLLIQVGDAEVLRDEITLLAHKATLAGVEVRHELYEDAVRLFYLPPIPIIANVFIDPRFPSIPFSSCYTPSLRFHARLCAEYSSSSSHAVSATA